MPYKYPDEFRARTVALVSSGQTVTGTANDLGITDSCVCAWIKRDRIADHVRGELVVDALDRARCRWQCFPNGTVVHAGRGAQHTPWVFGHRLRSAGLLGSMGQVASSVDNALI